MCVILHRLKGNKISKEEIVAAMDYNPDGYGIMYVEGNKVVHHKGFISEKELLEKIDSLGDKEFVLHFRIKTHGKIDVNNCHPFHVGNGTYMMHNGQLFIKTPNKNKSDTYHYADLLVKCRFDANNQKHINEVEKQQCKDKTFKNRLVFMTPKKVIRLGDWSMLGGNYWSNLRWKPSKQKTIGFNNWNDEWYRTHNHYRDNFDLYDNDVRETYVMCADCKKHVPLNTARWHGSKYLCRKICTQTTAISLLSNYDQCKNCSRETHISDLEDGVCKTCEDYFASISSSKCPQCKKGKSPIYFDYKVGLCNSCVTDNNISYGRDYVPCTSCNINKPTKDSSYCLSCAEDDDTVVIEDNDFIECPQCHEYDSSEKFNCSYCNNRKTVLKCATCNGEGTLGGLRNDYCDDCGGMGSFPTDGEENNEDVKTWKFTVFFPTNQYRNTDISLITHKLNESGIEVVGRENTFHDKKLKAFRMKFTVNSDLETLEKFIASNKDLEFSYRKS